MARCSGGGALVAIAATLAATTGSARGGAAVAPVRVVAAVPAADGSARQLILVGAAGQLYLPTGDGVWKREALGGVAVPVRGALRGRSGSIYVTGVHAPFYRWSQGSWQVRPVPNRGRMVAASASGVPAMAVERHVYVQRGKRWTRLATHRKAVTSLWAGDQARVYVGDADGGIARYGKGGFATIQTTHAGLAPGDSVAAFAGRSGKDLYAVTAQGVLLAISATRATALAGADKLEGARALLLGGSSGGIFAVVEAGAKRMLAELRGNALTWVDDLPPIASGDHLAVLASDRDGWIVIVTTNGSVALRAPDGSWTTGQVSGELPASATRSFDQARPAHAP